MILLGLNTKCKHCINAFGRCNTRNNACQLRKAEFANVEEVESKEIEKPIQQNNKSNDSKVTKAKEQKLKSIKQEVNKDITTENNKIKDKRNE